MMFTVLFAASLIPAADAPKADAEKVPAEIKGEWKIVVATHGTQQLMSSDGVGKFTISDKEAEGALPYLSKKDVKGTIKVDSSKKPPTIELKVGDDIFRGIYRYRKNKDGKTESLRILWNKAGGDFPKEMPEGFNLPKDFKGVLSDANRKTK